MRQTIDFRRVHALVARGCPPDHCGVENAVRTHLTNQFCSLLKQKPNPRLCLEMACQKISNRYVRKDVMQEQTENSLSLADRLRTYTQKLLDII